MKRKILSIVAALGFTTIALAAPASATGDQPDADNKPVTFCHYAGSNDHGGSGKYVKLTTNVAAFYNAGHVDHSNDIWEAFTYTTKGGDVVNVPAQGDTSLLAFEDCQEPKVDEKVAKPEAVFADECGTKNDVFSVAPGRGYTVGNVVKTGTDQSITVTLDEGFIWADGSKTPITFTKPLFTDVDCGLPETGGIVHDNQSGLMALGGIAVVGGLMLMRRRAS